MNQSNPYQSTAVNPSPQVFSTTGTTNLVASPYAISRLVASKGWVRFISVLHFVYFGILLIAGISMMVIMSTASAGGIGAVGFLLLVVMGLLIFLLGLGLSRYASAMSRLVHSNHPLDLEVAMVAQMKFWRLAGILSIIYTIFSVIKMLA